MESRVQTVLFPKNKFTIGQALAWIRRHGFIENFHNKGVDITDKYLRYRQFDPNKNSKYFTKILNDGVHLVMQLR